MPMPRHNHADQFSKNVLRDALSRASTAETEVEVLAATQRIDVYAVPDPARVTEREEMGLLGELSAEPSLFEPFRNTPSLGRVRRCLCKQLTWHHELERRARAASGMAADEEDDGPQVIPLPWLVVIGPGRPETALELYACKPIRPGVYEAVAGVHMRVVVLAELPRTRETLLLRMLATGQRLMDALEDLSALPQGAWEKSIVAPLLVHFGLDVSKEAIEEDDMSAEIRAWVEEYERKQRDEFLAKGRAEGRAEEAARSLVLVLHARGFTVLDAARERILAQKDPEQLERWIEKAAVATSLTEVLDEPS